MNQLYVGFSKQVPLPKGGFLLIDDEVPKIKQWRNPRYFDVDKHSFNPLQGIDETRARELAELLYTIYPQGQNTLTVRNGRWDLAPALKNAKRLDLVEGKEEVQGLMGDVLFSPLLRKVLCSSVNFTFNPNVPNLVRLNRAEIGEFNALVIGLFMLSEFDGQCIVPDGGFYLRDVHTRLIREERLVAGLYNFDELPDKLRKSAWQIADKVFSRASAKDAEEEATLLGLIKGTNARNEFVAGAVA